jgi:predicted dehydrogenase
MRVGLLGCGNVSPQYAIGLGLFPGVELVACADLDGPRAEALAAKHGIAALSPDELIGGDAVDILVNISPGMAHVGVSSAALAAGKHVYSEKPLAVDVTGGTLLLERSRASGLRLGCAPDTFLGSQLQTARRLLDAGAIGTPVAAHVTMIGGGQESWHPNPAIFYTPAGDRCSTWAPTT